MKLSIVTAAYNGAEFLADLIESVRNQAYQNIEHVIVNDGSTDNGATAGVLSSFPYIKVIHQENAGQYAAQNRGLEEATGDLILIINQDDVLADSQVVEKVVERFKADSDLDFVYSKVGFVSEKGESLPYRRAVEKRMSPWFMSNVSAVAHQGLYFRKAMLDKHGIRFDPSLKVAGDWDFFIRVVKQCTRYEWLDLETAKFRIHKGQMTQKGGRKAFSIEEKIICKRYSINPVTHRVLRVYLDLKTRVINVARVVKTKGLIHAFKKLVKR